MVDLTDRRKVRARRIQATRLQPFDDNRRMKQPDQNFSEHPLSVFRPIRTGRWCPTSSRDGKAAILYGHAANEFAGDHAGGQVSRQRSGDARLPLSATSQGRGSFPRYRE
jgi:hypothetical protein